MWTIAVFARRTVWARATKLSVEGNVRASTLTRCYLEACRWISWSRGFDRMGDKDRSGVVRLHLYGGVVHC